MTDAMTDSPTPPDLTRAEVCAFDMFGTLFDVHSVVQACRDAFGEEGEAFSEFWRREQLEYSWKRSLMRRWVPFFEVTRDALDATLRVYGRAGDAALRDRLLSAYRRVAPYPDTREGLEALEAAGVRRVILTNGSGDMVASTLAAAGFGALFERVFTVDELRVFKPDPDVYRMASDGLGLDPGRILMVSSHPWDLSGAISFGFQGVWVDRPGGGHHVQNLGYDPHYRVEGMAGLAELLAGRAREA